MAERARRTVRSSYVVPSVSTASPSTARSFSHLVILPRGIVEDIDRHLRMWSTLLVWKLDSASAPEEDLPRHTDRKALIFPCSELSSSSFWFSSVWSVALDIEDEVRICGSRIRADTPWHGGREPDVLEKGKRRWAGEAGCVGSF